MLATVGDKRAFEGNYGPSNVLTLIVGNQYRMKAFSNAKPVRDAAIGDTVEILSFIPTKVDEWKGQVSLMVRSLKIRPIEQEGFNAAMLGPALLMDPSLTTLALCAIVGTVLMAARVVFDEEKVEEGIKYEGIDMDEYPMVGEYDQNGEEGVRCGPPVLNHGRVTWCNDDSILGHVIPQGHLDHGIPMRFCPTCGLDFGVTLSVTDNPDYERNGGCRMEIEEFNGFMLAPALLMDPSMATLALCGLVAVIGATRTYLIQEREVIGNTYAVEAESWDEAMEKYDNHDVVGDEAIQDTWECLDDLAPKPLGMVILRPCKYSLSHRLSGEISDYRNNGLRHPKDVDLVEWVKKGRDWGNGKERVRVKRCYHTSCLSQKDCDRPGVPYNLAPMRINDDGICHTCVELEAQGWTLRPQPAPDHPLRADAIKLIEQRVADFSRSEDAVSHTNPEGYIWNSLRTTWGWPDGKFREETIEQYCNRLQREEEGVTAMGAVAALPLVFLDPSGISLGAFIGIALTALISMQLQKVKSQTTESGEREIHYALADYLSENEDKPTPSDEQMAFINDYCHALEEWVEDGSTGGPRMVCEAVAGSGKTFVIKIMLDCTGRIEASLVTRASAFNRNIAQTMKDVLKALMKEGFTGADIIGGSNSVQAAGAAIVRLFYEKQGMAVKWQGPTTPIGDQRWRVMAKLAVTEAMTPEVIQSVVASGLLEKPNQRPYYNRIVTDVTKTVKALADAGYLPEFTENVDLSIRIDDMKEIVKRVEGPMGLREICIHWIPNDRGWVMVDEAFMLIVQTAQDTTEITVEDDCLVPRLGGYTTDLAPLSVCAHEAKKSITDFKVASGLFWPPREEEEKARNRMPAGSAALTLTRIEGLKDGLEGYNGKLLVQFGDGRAANTTMEDAEGEAIPAQQWVKHYAPGHRNGARFGGFWPDVTALMTALNLDGDWLRIIDEHDPTVEMLARRFSTLRGGKGFNGPDQASGPTPQSDTMILSFADQVFLPNYFDLYLDEKWDVAFIDELQDLSRSRAQLIWRCIDPDYSAIICCGDRKQAIYFWSGSSTTAFDDTIKHIDATTYPMTYSWRGGNHVAEAAVRICAEGLEDCKAVQPDADYPDYSVHSAPPIEGWRDGGRTVTIDHSRIADAVKHIRESEYPLSDTEKPIAVLSYLTGALSGVIIQLVKAGIPITTPAGDQGIVTTVCNLLNKPFRDQLYSKKQKQGVGFNGLGDYSEYAIMSRLERVERMEFDQAVKRANGDVALADKDDYYNEVRDILEMAECLIELWASAIRLNELEGRRTVAQFKKWCNGVLFAAKGDSVHLSTVHRFKGDEAGIVFMLRGVPVKNRRTGEEEVRDPFLIDHLLKQSPDTACEQMNVLYVAATRALDQTIVVRSDDLLKEIPAGAILNDSWGVVAGYSTTTIRDGPPPVVIGESGEWPDGDPDEQTTTLRCGDCGDRVNPDDHAICPECDALLCNHRVPERGARGGKLSSAGNITTLAFTPQIITDKTNEGTGGRGITSCGVQSSRGMTFDDLFGNNRKSMPRICFRCYEMDEEE
jgi:hypothetical protein